MWLKDSGALPTDTGKAQIMRRSLAAAITSDDGSRAYKCGLIAGMVLGIAETLVGVFVVLGLLH